MDALMPYDLYGGWLLLLIPGGSVCGVEYVRYVYPHALDQIVGLVDRMCTYPHTYVGSNREVEQRIYSRLLYRSKQASSTIWTPYPFL